MRRLSSVFARSTERPRAGRGIGWTFRFMKKGQPREAALDSTPNSIDAGGMSVHSAAALRHPAAHPAFVLVLGDLAKRRFRGDEERSDGGRVLQRGAHHLARADDARLDQVLVLLVEGVEA